MAFFFDKIKTKLKSNKENFQDLKIIINRKKLSPFNNNAWSYS